MSKRKSQRPTRVLLRLYDREILAAHQNGYSCQEIADLLKVMWRAEVTRQAIHRYINRGTRSGYCLRKTK